MKQLPWEQCPFPVLWLAECTGASHKLSDMRETDAFQTEYGISWQEWLIDPDNYDKIERHVVEWWNSLPAEAQFTMICNETTLTQNKLNRLNLALKLFKE